MPEGRIVVGTSTWTDPGYVEQWYPAELPAREHLRWYAERFEGVEVDATFHGLPDRRRVQRWVERTRPGFGFDVKLHRLLSRHSAGVDSLLPELRPKATTDERGRVVLTPELQDLLVDATLDAIEPLAQAGKLGPFLLQLSPSFSPRKHELSELEPLAEALREPGLAIELRNRNWAEGEQLEATLDWYEDNGVTFVCVDSPPGDNFQILPPVDAVTRRDVAYLRMHGRNTEGYLKGKSVAERFGWVYSEDELKELAGRARSLSADAAEVHVAFNNNRSSDAPDSARRFRELIGQDPGPAPDAPTPGEQMELA